MAIEDANVVVVAHNTDADPLFIYSNHAHRFCFGYSWVSSWPGHRVCRRKHLAALNTSAARKVSARFCQRISRPAYHQIGAAVSGSGRAGLATRLQGRISYMVKRPRSRNVSRGLNPRSRLTAGNSAPTADQSRGMLL